MNTMFRAIENGSEDVSVDSISTVGRQHLVPYILSGDKDDELGGVGGEVVAAGEEADGTGGDVYIAECGGADADGYGNSGGGEKGVGGTDPAGLFGVVRGHRRGHSQDCFNEPEAPVRPASGG
jgi:hypothetical protein